MSEQLNEAAIAVLQYQIDDVEADMLIKYEILLEKIDELQKEINDLKGAKL